MVRGRRTTFLSLVRDKVMLHDWKHLETNALKSAARWRRANHLLIPVLILLLATLLNCTGGSQVFSQSSDASLAESKIVPVYRFETQFIQEWLMLGPLLRDDELANPDKGLSDPFIGKEVLMKSGETATWKLVSLTYPSNYQTMSSARKLAYMFCKIKKGKNMSDGLKQFYFGSDDAGKVWINGELVVEFNEPRWHNTRSDPFQFPVGDQEITCLLELRDMGGEHSFSLGSGFSFRGRCLCLDEVTPQQDISASLIQDETTIETAWSSSTGLFEIDMIPYAADTHLILTSGKRRIRWPDHGSLTASTSTTPIPLPVANATRLERFSAREGFPGGAIDAIAEMPDGRIIAGAANLAFIFDGRTAIETCRLPDDCHICAISVSRTGTVWLATLESGLFRVRPDQAPERFATPELGNCIYDIELDSAGSLWVSSGMTPIKHLHGSPIRCDIHQIDRRHRIVRQKIGNSNLIIDIACDSNRGVAFVQLIGPIFLRNGNGVTREIDIWPTRQKNLISSIAFDHEDRLWVNRTHDVGCFQSSGEWKVIPVPYSVASQLPRNRICVDIQGKIWLTKTNWLFQIQDDQPVFFGKTGITREICATKNGSVYVANSEGISKIVAQSVKRIDHRYGMDIKSPVRIESLGKSILVSGVDGSMQIDADGNTVWIDNQFVINSPWGSRYRFHNGLKKYSRGDVDTTVRPIELFADNTQRIVETTDKILTTSLCYFSDYLDFGLVGQNGEIYELRGNQLSVSWLLKNYFKDRPAKPIMDIIYVPPGDPLAGYWITRDDHIVLWRTETGGKFFELASIHNQAHRFFRRSNGDLLVATAKGVRRFDIQRSELVEDSWMTRFSDYDIVDIAESKSGMLWIATRSSGIYGERMGIWSSLDTVDHLRDIHIFDIEIDDLENLWIASAEGLLVFSPNHIPPTVSIEAITVQGDLRRRISSPNPTEIFLNEPFVVRLAGVDDTSPSTSFRYRTGGENGEWIQVAPNQDEVTLVLERQGEHLFEFQSVDQDANVSTPVALTVQTKLHYWQTAWFHVLTALTGIGSVLLVLGLVVVLNQNRMEKRKAQHELFQEQRRAKEFAEEASQEKVMLLARVCHDLRSPLSIVQLCLERDVNSQSEAEQIRKLLAESASQMSYLTDQLLSYSATENPRDLRKNVVEVAEFLSLIESSTALRLANSPVQFRIEISPSAPKWLRLDRRRMTEVLNNLVENSLRYTESGLIVLSYLSRDDGRPILRLSDTGSGMSKVTLEKVLTPFFRDSSSGHSTQANKGVGLGLTICSSLVRQMEGDFEIKSEVGSGTEVTITLPQSVISDGKGCVKKPHGRVFVIDSHASQRRSLRQLLNSIGWRCESGDESTSLDMIRQFKPDVVIVDMVGSNETALAFTKKIREALGSRIILIAMSNPAKLIHSTDSKLFDHLVDKTRVFQSNTENLVHLMASSRHN